MSKNGPNMSGRGIPTLLGQNWGHSMGQKKQSQKKPPNEHFLQGNQGKKGQKGGFSFVSALLSAKMG